MAGMFECHDKSRLEATATSIGPDDGSEIRQRLKRSFDVFIDANVLSDEEIASLIRKAEIDILIDLKGFTRDARTGILARRPAPIQVNYLGYPGTMGASYIDYIIADHTVIPNEDRKFYTETIRCGRSMSLLMSLIWPGWALVASSQRRQEGRPTIRQRC